MGPRKSRTEPISPTLVRALVRTADRIAASAGALVARRHRAMGRAMRRKGVGDFVTEVDVAAEMHLRRELRAAWPDHGVLGEELPAHAGDAPFVWVLDPIDGTSNYGSGLPIYAVSVACLHAGAPVAAAIHCLPEGVTYRAGHGLGAHRGRTRLDLRTGPGRRGRLGAASILGVQWHRGPRPLRYLEPLVATGTRLRNFGCTVAHLADVAAGRLDGNVQEQGRLWDFAAAALVVTEAGGRFTTWDGTPVFPLDALDTDAHVPSLAGRPAVHAELVGILAPYAARIHS